VTIVAVMLVAFAAIVAYSHADAVRHARRAARTDARFQAGLAAAAIDEAITTSAESTVATMASTPGVAAILATPQACDLSSDALGVFPASHLTLLNLDGTVACSSQKRFAHGGATYAAAPWWSSVTTAPATFPPFADPVVGGDPAIAVAATIVDNGTPAGVAVLGLPVKGLGDRVAATYGGPDHDVFVITSADGSVISAPSNTDPAWQEVTEFTTATAGTFAGADHVVRLFASAPATARGWRVFAGTSQATVDAAANDALRKNTSLAVVALLFMAALVALVYRKIARPLRSITSAVALAGREPSPSGVAVKGPKEIGVLADEFNGMLRARLGYEQRITHQAMHDALTGLPNRALLTDRLDQALAKARSGQASVAVLFVDIDRFKVVNDSLGHDAGDRVLVAVANRLRESVEPGDTVARFGSDEFVVLCERLDTPDEALLVAERIRRALETPIPVHGMDLGLAASIGIAVGHDAADAESLLRDADTALDRAKGMNSSGLQIFDQDLRERAERRLELEAGLRHALQARELSVVYQPIVAVSSGDVVGVEALVRWNHPVHGEIPPLEFIPLAEETGQVIAIGRFVLEEACRQVAAWNEQGHHVRMSVNLSARQLTRGDLVETVARCLATYRIEPSQLCLELTETALLQSTVEGAATLQTLYDRGVHVSLDDFGTGYSSLSYLQQLPVDAMKIDRSFVERLGRDSSASEFVAAIMALARALSLDVVAEGVETIEQLAELRRHGCSLVQGYLFARPQPAAAVTAVLESSGRLGVGGSRH
jgi:diguanylate cyclase (GGDEF)-like protein